MASVKLLSERILGDTANSAEEGNLTEAIARKALTEIFYIFSNRELKLYSVREWMAEWSEMKTQNEPLSTSLNRNRSVAHILGALKKQQISGLISSLQKN